MSRAIAVRWVAVAAGILGLLAWLAWRSSTGGVVRREPGLNILLITIDTLRADAIGAYGQPGGVTPWIDRLAAAGVRFTSAHAHNVVTLPSHGNILSGRLPTDHGVRDNSGYRFPDSIETLATLLESQGYRTGAFVSAFPLASRFGLARGFDVYDDRFGDGAPPAFLIQERRGPDTIERARRWLDARRGGPSFCWVHLYEPHFPYEPREPFASRFPANPYQAEVASADAALGPLLEPILAAGRDGGTVVVLTADHGESLGDHGEATHGVFAYEPVLKVPLVIYQPRLFAPAVVRTPAGHIDLLPTMLDAIALPAPAGLPGRSLLPAVAGPPDQTGMTPPVTYFEALSASLNRRWAPLEGVIQGTLKYIELPVPELYDLAADPQEARNLAASQPGRVEELRALLRPFRGRAAVVPRTRETAETRDRLRSLGYIASEGRTAAPRHTEADDPKRLIGLDVLLQEVVALYLAGHLEAALARCRELVERRPDAPLSLVSLAHLERESGNLPGAIRALQKAVSLEPEHTEAVALLGAYLTQAGRAADAVALMEPYARGQPDVDVLRAHALALAKLGRSREALATLALARDTDPSNGALLIDTGTAYLMAGDRERARASFERALDANPALARAHTSLAVLDLDQRRLDHAAEHWTAAIALDSRELVTIAALGTTLARAGRTVEARAALQFFIIHATVPRYRRDLDRARALLATLQ